MTQVFLAERSGTRLTLLAKLDEAEDAPDGHQYLEARLVRMRWTSAGSRQVLLVESEMRFVDFDPGVDEGYRWERRHLTVCARSDSGALSCGLRLPLETVAGSFETSADDSFVPTRENVRRHHAIAVLRDDGTLRLRLREGTWEGLLFCGMWCESFPPPEPTAGSVILPFVAEHGAPWSTLDHALAGRTVRQ